MNAKPSLQGSRTLRMFCPLRRCVYSQLHCQALPGQDQRSDSTTQSQTQLTLLVLRLQPGAAHAVHREGLTDGRGEQGRTDGGA
eukprot:4128895-Pyramimonas_sp.AAC.1